VESELNKLKEVQEEANAERESMRERLNEAIQDRWLVQEKISKMQKEAEREQSKPSAGVPSMAEVEQKQREMTRRTQDLEGELKRAKMELQTTKEKLGGTILKDKERDAETAKLNKALKDMANQIVELEHDLNVSEKTCDEYEELVAQLKNELEKK
jgi:chromosome segregation ATPase